MRIAAVSDIHHPASTILVKLAHVLRKSEVDLVVFAGDIVNWADEKYFKKLLRFIRKFLKGPLLAVSGNHEHWLSGREKRRGLTSIEKLNKLAKLYEEYNGVLLDVKGPCKIGDLYVVGVVGWYDYSYARGLGFTEKDFENCNPWGYSLHQLEIEEKRGVGSCPSWFRDCLYVKLGMSAKEYAELNARKLRDQLARVGSRRSIVVLHHCPRRDLIKYTGNRYEDFYLAYAGHQKLDNIIRSCGKVFLVIYGHLHEKALEPTAQKNGLTYINPYPLHRLLNGKITLIEVDEYKGKVVSIEFV